jgi:type IV secretory pathway TrbD component
MKRITEPNKPARLTTHRVYDVVQRPLTIWGVERRLWMFGVLLGVATFNATGSLLAGSLVFLVLFAPVRLSTQRDSRFLSILSRNARYRARYDGGKYHPVRFIRQDHETARPAR